MRPLNILIITAFLFRFALLVTNTYLFTLPESGKDDRRFEALAWAWSKESTFPNDEFARSGAGVFIKGGALLYQVIGHAPFAWGLIMVILGTVTVYNIYKATLLLWANKKQALRVGWIAALFPEFAMLSCLLLREVVIHFFLSLAAISLIKYWKHKKATALITFVLYTGLCTIFHSAMVVALAGLGLAVFIISQEGKKKSVFYKVAAFALVAGGLAFINATGIGLSKFGGSLDGAFDKFQAMENSEALGSAAYPAWLKMSGGSFDMVKLPLRLVAFLFSPAIPFMVRSFSHLVGLADAAFYIYIFYSYYKNRKSITANKSAYVVLIVSVMLTGVYSLGVSNFGTAIRHRAKMLPLYMILAIDYKALRRSRRLQQKKRLALEAQKKTTLAFNDVSIATNKQA